MSLLNNDPIHELEPETKARIRSTQILTSLTHLVSELVQNSLDAGASHVEIGMDPVDWECWVRDNGQGIPAEGLETLAKGHTKGRYNTSKTYDHTQAGSGTFGFRGEGSENTLVLNVPNLSILISACVSYGNLMSGDIFADSAFSGKQGGEKLYLGPSVRWRRERPGTTVVARDIFFNVPVRRKSHPNMARTLELTKKELETLALVFPNVSFTLDHTHAGKQSRILTINRTASSLAAFRAIYGGALAARAEEINLRSEDLGLEGFISLEGSQSRAFQNFYVNKHPLVFGEIQRAIEKCFISSAFGRFSSDEQDRHHTTPRARRSPKKVERKPIYVLNLSVPSSQVDNFVEPAKSMVQFQDTGRVLAFIIEVINRFLSKGNMISTQPHYANTSLGTPRKRARQENVRPTLEYTRDYLDTRTTQPPTSDPSSTKKAHYPAQILASLDEPLACFDDTGYFEWVDPTSGDSFLVDSNTGNSFPSNKFPEHLHANDAVDSSQKRADSGRRSLKPAAPVPGSSVEASHDIPEWLTKAMAQKTTFPLVETSIFSTQQKESNAHGSKTYLHTHRVQNDIYASNFSQSSKPTSETFSANDLKKAQIVAQVDTKFILCVLKRPDKVLALVDQHAADERVRVERYLKQLCSDFLRGNAETLLWDKPKPVLLTRREAEILQGTGLVDSLGRWGLWLELSLTASQHLPTRGAEFIQIDVVGVPRIVGTKLSNERELSEFVKSMINAVETNQCDSWPTASTYIQDEKDWARALRNCPEPLMGLVNSKACRGAIMFNDPLDQHQCEDLIRGLSETVFPFQCAHGRPSIAPLTKISSLRSSPDMIDWEAFDQMEV